MPDLDTDPDAGKAHTRAPRGKEAERILAAEMLAELRAMRQTMTEQAAKLAGRLVNNTLEVRTAVFDADGVIALEFNVAAGAIRINNLSAAGAVTVTSAGAAGYAPFAGIGVYVVQAGQRETIALASRLATMYGVVGERVSYQVFAGAVGPTT